MHQVKCECIVLTVFRIYYIQMNSIELFYLINHNNMTINSHAISFYTYGLRMCVEIKINGAVCEIFLHKECDISSDKNMFCFNILLLLMVCSQILALIRFEVPPHFRFINYPEYRFQLPRINIRSRPLQAIKYLRRRL